MDIYANLSGALYRMDVRSDDTISIYQHQNGHWEWVGDGRWEGGIVDCPALEPGECIALDEAIAPSDDTIRELAREAGAAGDQEQVELCRRALMGDEDARAECAQAISEALAAWHDDED